MVEDCTVRARFVEGAERGSKSLMEYGFEEDGYCTEGPKCISAIYNVRVIEQTPNKVTL